MKKLVATTGRGLDKQYFPELFHVMEAPFILRTLVVLQKLGIRNLFLGEDALVNRSRLEGNPKFLKQAFRFLESIGYIEREGAQDELYRATPIGKEMFVMTPLLSAQPDSYRAFLNDLELYAEGKPLEDKRLDKRLWHVPDGKHNEVFYVMEGSLILRTLIVLWKTEATSKILAGNAHLHDLPGNRAFMEMAVRFLESVGYVTQREGVVQATDLGKFMMEKTASFGVPDMYREYLSVLENIAHGEEVHVVVNDRAVNVKGSGTVNVARYYPKTFHFLRDANAGALLDVGCGAFTFNRTVEAALPNKFKHAGADFNEDALAVARQIAQGLELVGHGPVIFQGDVMEPERLARDLSRSSSREIDPVKTLISVWHIFQEGFRRYATPEEAEANLPTLLTRYHSAFGGQGMIIGELFDVDPAIVAISRGMSVAAVYRYFHDLSGQMLLRRQAWFDAYERSGVWAGIGQGGSRFYSVDEVGPREDRQTWLGIATVQSRAA